MLVAVNRSHPTQLGTVAHRVHRRWHTAGRHFKLQCGTGHRVFGHGDLHGLLCFGDFDGQDSTGLSVLRQCNAHRCFFCVFHQEFHRSVGLNTGGHNDVAQPHTRHVDAQHVSGIGIVGNGDAYLSSVPSTATATATAAGLLLLLASLLVLPQGGLLLLLQLPRIRRVGVLGRFLLFDARQKGVLLLFQLRHEFIVVGLLTSKSIVADSLFVRFRIPSSGAPTRSGLCWKHDGVRGREAAPGKTIVRVVGLKCVVPS